MCNPRLMALFALMIAKVNCENEVFKLAECADKCKYVNLYTVTLNDCFTSLLVKLLINS